LAEDGHTRTVTPAGVVPAHLTRVVPLRGAGKNGGVKPIEQMPRVGFGTWQLHGQRAYEAVGHALRTGYRHIDTATMYGNEAEVGRALRDSGLAREDVFVTTKLLPDHAGDPARALRASLAALDTGHVDLWLIHWPPHGDTSVRAWRGLIAARDAGQARAVGVSNYSIRQIDQLAEATGETPAVNQVPWSPAQHDEKFLADSRERGVLVEGYSPIKGTDLRDPVLVDIAQRHGVSVPQVVLRWHLEHEIVVIPRSVRPERIESNFDLFGFELTADEVARIDRLSTA
jgi:2,5-diketo-D-gluconate reductase A